MNTLPHLFRHHRWATLTLIDHLASRPADELQRRVPGGFGTVADTLTHVIHGESRYLDTLRGVERGANPPPPPGASLPELRAAAARNGERLIALASSVSETGRVTGVFRGEPFDYPAYIPLFQAYHHGVEHRTNITTILATFDLPVPGIDLWAFNAAGEPS